MKITISANDVLPGGEYELTDRNKLDNAKNNFSFPPSDRQILIEYDRIGGRIVKNGEVLPVHSLWSIEKNRPMEEYSNDEIVEVLRRGENMYAPLGNYQRAKNEWQLRQQAENSKQTGSLIKEIKKLKEITEKNAESDNKLARIAIIIAVVSLIVQTAFSIHHKLECRWNGVRDREEYHSECYRTFDLGILGTISIKVEDFTVPIK